jgi:hypothetical protein
MTTAEPPISARSSITRRPTRSASTPHAGLAAAMPRLAAAVQSPAQMARLRGEWTWRSRTRKSAMKG